MPSSGATGFAKGIVGGFQTGIQFGSAIKGNQAAKEKQNFELFSKGINDLQKSTPDPVDFKKRAEALSTLYGTENVWQQMSATLDYEGQWKKQTQYLTSLVQTARLGKKLTPEQIATGINQFGDKFDDVYEGMLKLDIVGKEQQLSLAKQKAEVTQEEAKAEQAPTIALAGAQKAQREAASAKYRVVNNTLVDVEDPSKQIPVAGIPGTTQGWIAQQLGLNKIDFNRATELTGKLKAAEKVEGKDAEAKLDDVRSLVKTYYSKAIGGVFSVGEESRGPFKHALELASQNLKRNSDLSATDAFTQAITELEGITAGKIAPVGPIGLNIGSPQQTETAVPIDEADSTFNQIKRMTGAK